MVDGRVGLGACVMLAVSLQAAAAIQPTPRATGAPAATATAPRLTLFGVPQSRAAVERLDGPLRDIAQRYPTLAADHQVRNLHAINPAARFRLSSPLATPEVLIDAITTGDPQALKSALEGLGLRDGAVFSNDVGGWLSVDQLSNANALNELHFARAAMPRTRSSIVATQGDFVQKSAAIRTTYPSLTGTGIKVGVISDSFNCFAQYAGGNVPASGSNGYAPFGFTATYTDDQAPSSGQAASTSALPAGVNVVEEASCLQYGQPDQLPFTDEGRAILQIVHAVAPGASLSFYTAVNSEADFAKGITTLAQDGAKVIVDDVGYPDEPFFQDGEVAQAINTVAAQGVVYFSSAGNDGHLSYENTAPKFSVAGTGSQAGEMLLNFDPSGATSTTTLPLSIPKLFPGEFIYLVVEWDQPFVTGSSNSGGSSSAIDLCLQGAGTDLVTDYTSYPNAVTCTGASSIGKDPVQYLLIGNPANASGYTTATNVTLTIGLQNGTTVPGRIKFVLEDDGAGSVINSPFNTNSPTIQGHPGAATAAAVGAAFYIDTPQCGATSATLESYSSAGGDPILFDTSGNRLATPVTRQKPDFVGPDGVNNTMLGDSQTITTNIAGCEDHPFDNLSQHAFFPNFYGTSAAAPHAAAAAALMLQANPALTPAQIITALQTSALAMGSSSSGSYDFNDGHGFVQVDAAFAQLPAAAPSISVSPSTITVGSSATLTWVGINVSGCTASGAWSGSQSTGGSQTVTPSATGSDTYTLTCTGANGTVSSSTTLTVNAASSSGHHGGALDLITILALGGVLFTGRALGKRLPT
jgi:subtilisin family serine protease